MEISEEKLKKIEAYIKEGRFKSVDEFVDKAVDLLLYAEDRKEEITEMMRESFKQLKKEIPQEKPQEEAKEVKED